MQGWLYLFVGRISSEGNANKLLATLGLMACRDVHIGHNVKGQTFLATFLAACARKTPAWIPGSCLFSTGLSSSNKRFTKCKKQHWNMNKSKIELRNELVLFVFNHFTKLPPLKKDQMYVTKVNKVSSLSKGSIKKKLFLGTGW